MPKEVLYGQGYLCDRYRCNNTLYSASPSRNDRREAKRKAREHESLRSLHLRALEVVDEKGQTEGFMAVVLTKKGYRSLSSLTHETREIALGEAFAIGIIMKMIEHKNEPDHSIHKIPVHAHG